MQKKFIVNIFILVLVNLAVKPLWIFGVDRNVQLALGDTQYGLYAALLNISIVFNIFLDIGLTNYNTKVIAQDASAIQHNLVNIAIIKALLFVVYIIAVIVFGALFGYSSTSLYYLFLLGCLQFLNSFVTFLRSNISANQFFKTDSIISITDKIVVIILFASYYLMHFNLNAFTIQLFLYYQIIGYIIAIIVAALFTKKVLLFPVLQNKKTFIDIIKNSLPYAILILLMGIYIRSDLFLIERLLPNGALQSGQYAKSFRLLDAFNMIGFLFAGMLLPMFAKLLADSKSVVPLLTISTKLLMPASVLIAIFCGFQSAAIMQFVYHTHDTVVNKAFVLVIAVLPAMSAMNIFSTLLTSAGKIKTLIGITSFGAALSVVANYIVIHYYQHYIAVCIVAIVVQYCINIAYYIYCCKTFGVLFAENIGFKIMVITLIFIVLNAGLYFMHFGLVPCFIVNIISYIPVLYWLGLLQINNWKQYFTNK